MSKILFKGVLVFLLIIPFEGSGLTLSGSYSYYSESLVINKPVERLMPYGVRKDFFWLLDGPRLSDQNHSVSNIPSHNPVFENVRTSSGWSKVRDITLYSLAHSLFDYIGYNLTKHDENSLLTYRVLQGGVKTGLFYDLNRRHGWNTAVGFALTWWTGFHDFLYYAWAETLDLKRYDSRFEGRGSMRKFTESGGTWFWWTAYGLYQGGGQRTGVHLKGPELLTQMFTGLAAGYTLSISFDGPPLNLNRVIRSLF